MFKKDAQGSAGLHFAGFKLFARRREINLILFAHNFTPVVETSVPPVGLNVNQLIAVFNLN